MITKLKLSATIALVLGVAGLLVLEQLRMQQLMAENADLRHQLSGINSVQETNASLAGQLQAALAASQANQHELLRLRARAARLRQLEQENALLKSAGQPTPPQTAPVPGSSPEPDTVVAVPAMSRAIDESSLDVTDLGALELQSGVAAHFDLGGGTNCVITPTVLPDGNHLVEIKLGVTNAQGVLSELGTSRLTARPGQPAAVSAGNRMIGLTVTVKP